MVHCTGKRFIYIYVISRDVNLCPLNMPNILFKISLFLKKLFPNTIQNILYNIEYFFASLHIFLEIGYISIDRVSFLLQHINCAAIARAC